MSSSPKFFYEVEAVPGLVFVVSVWNNGGPDVATNTKYRFDRYVGPVDEDGDGEVAQDMRCFDCGQHLGWELGNDTRFYGYCDRCAFRHIKYSVIRSNPRIMP